MGSIEMANEHSLRNNVTHRTEPWESKPTLLVPDGNTVGVNIKTETVDVADETPTCIWPSGKVIIKSEFPTDPNPLWPSVTVSGEEQTFSRGEWPTIKTELLTENPLLQAGIKPRPLQIQTLKQEDADSSESFPNGETETMETDTNVLLADYDPSFRLPSSPSLSLPSYSGLRPLGSPSLRPLDSHNLRPLSSPSLWPLSSPACNLRPLGSPTCSLRPLGSPSLRPLSSPPGCNSSVSGHGGNELPCTHSSCNEDKTCVCVEDKVLRRDSMCIRAVRWTIREGNAPDHSADSSWSLQSFRQNLTSPDLHVPTVIKQEHVHVPGDIRPPMEPETETKETERLCEGSAMDVDSPEMKPLGDICRVHMNGGVQSDCVHVPETIQVLPERGLVTDTNAWGDRCMYQSSEYQPIIKLERLPNVGAVSLGADCDRSSLHHVHRPTHEAGREGTMDMCEVNKEDKNEALRPKDTLSLQTSTQPSNEIHVKRSHDPQTLMRSSDDDPIQSLSVSADVLTRSGNTEIYERPLQTTDQNLDKLQPRNSGDVSATCTTNSNNFPECSAESANTNLHKGEKVKTLTCKVCNKTLSSAKYLKIHMFIHTGDKPHKCDVCEKSFPFLDYLKAHQVKHTGERRYSCAICQKRFRCTAHLRRHVNTHTGEKPYTCEVCQKSFAGTGCLRRHMLTHTGEKPYTCDICDKKFAVSGCMKRHRMIHTGEKPHTCDICHKGFASSSYLKRHRIVHTGEKPYTCTVCQKGFSDSPYLKQHQLVHTGEKPHTCDVCQKSFASPGYLKRHRWIHTGEKPYRCKLCQKGFRSTDQVKRHACSGRVVQSDTGAIP